MLASLDELGDRMPSLLNIDHPCAQRQIADARRVVEVCICMLVMIIILQMSSSTYDFYFLG